MEIVGGYRFALPILRSTAPEASDRSSSCHLRGTTYPSGSLRKPGHRGQCTAAAGPDGGRTCCGRRNADTPSVTKPIVRSEPNRIVSLAIHDWLSVPPLAVAWAWSFAETRSVGWISDSVIHHLPVARRITLSPIRPTVCSFIHSTFVREGHLGRRLTLSAICLYVGRVVTRAAAKLPH
jgi:hypothetical protein